ncbi:DUF397 domain-containing protein [Streptomyces sp. NPDC058257]|uniref:DUF397 domain-containing protein n=1 Tax=Streptomyces sp. NPDC058257 TaxID=3346409 RepID=UPI0036E9670A
MTTLHWQKSSHSSEGNNCVELATAPDGTIRLRESDTPAAVLSLNASNTDSLLDAIRQGTLEDHRK